jgi:hypothetical protein
MVLRSSFIDVSLNLCKSTLRVSVDYDNDGSEHVCLARRCTSRRLLHRIIKTREWWQRKHTRTGQPICLSLSPNLSHSHSSSLNRFWLQVNLFAGASRLSLGSFKLFFSMVPLRTLMTVQSHGSSVGVGDSLFESIMPC